VAVGAEFLCVCVHVSAFEGIMWISAYREKVQYEVEVLIMG